MTAEIIAIIPVAAAAIVSVIIAIRSNNQAHAANVKADANAAALKAHTDVTPGH